MAQQRKSVILRRVSRAICEATLAEYSEIGALRTSIAPVDPATTRSRTHTFPMSPVGLVCELDTDRSFGPFHLVTPLVDASVSYFQRSDMYQVDAYKMFVRRMKSTTAGTNFMVLMDIRPSAAATPTPVVFRFYIKTDFLFDNDGQCEVFKFIFGRGQPNFNATAVQLFQSTLNLAGIESTDPGPELRGDVSRAGVVTTPIAFQLNAIQAMRVMEDPSSAHGLKAVKDVTSACTDIWPRDCPWPIFFSPLSMSFELQPSRLHHTGGLLALGPGLGKTLIVVAHTMLTRDDSIRRMRAAPMEMCSVGTVVVADPYLHQHWYDQIAMHAPAAEVGDASHLLRPKPDSYVDFIVVDASKLFALGAARSELIINRICYDEAHRILSRMKRADVAGPRANSIWAVTATPGHAAYLQENMDNVTKVLRFPKINPSCAKYFPEEFNAIRRMIISGGGGVVADDLLPNLTTVSTHVALNAHDIGELRSIRSTPHVALDRTVANRIARAVQHSTAFHCAYEQPMAAGGLRPHQALLPVNPEGLFVDRDCSICYEPVTQRTALPCKHTYCYGCIAGVMGDNCPLCRVPFDPLDVKAVTTRVVDGPPPDPVEIKSVWKFNTTVDAVLGAVLANEALPAAGKTIVFTDTDFVLSLSTHLMAAGGLQSLWYLEACEERVRNVAIERFKKDPTRRVLVIDIALNAGLDLACADNIVFACRTPVSRDSHVFKQAVGRVRRLSQTSSQVRANILHFEKQDHIVKHLIA